jgi:hypothetical protein
VKTTNHRYINYFVLIITLFFFYSCDYFSDQKNLNENKALAKVYEKQLFADEVNSYLPIGIAKSDSIVLSKSYIKNWVSDEVFYHEATEYLSTEEMDFEKELNDYKKALISHKFQTKLISEKLDTVITQSEIESYYKKNSANFFLKTNIVKVLYVKVKNSIPNLEKLKKFFYSNDPKDAEQLNSLCIQFASNYYANSNSWLMFDELKKEIPQLKEVPENTIQNGKIYEFNDSINFYFLKIIEIKTKNSLSPINFEKNNIRSILLNERKQKLIHSIKKNFVEKAAEAIEIY